MTDRSVFRPPVETAQEDWPRLSDWLAQRGHVLDVTDVRQFSGGIANLNYLVRLDGARVVFRRPPPGPSAEGANDMAREWRVLSRLYREYPLAPRGIVFGDAPEIIGAPFQLIEYRDGVAVGGDLPAGLEADAPKRLTNALILAMAQLHRIDPAAVDLAELGKPEGFLGRQVDGWSRRAAAVWPDGMPPAAEHLIAKLRTAVPEPIGQSLLHMDLKFDNLLIDLRDCRVHAVIDWDMTTRGCPLFDIAVLLSYWIEAGDPADVRELRQVPSLAPGFGSRADLAEQYFAATGTAPQSLHWHVGCARLRLAVAWMQLYRRWQSGAVMGERYRYFERLAGAILDWAAVQFDEGKT